MDFFGTRYICVSMSELCILLIVRSSFSGLILCSVASDHLFLKIMMMMTTMMMTISYSHVTTLFAHLLNLSCTAYKLIFFFKRRIQIFFLTFLLSQQCIFCRCVVTQHFCNRNSSMLCWCRTMQYTYLIQQDTASVFISLRQREAIPALYTSLFTDR